MEVTRARWFAVERLGCLVIPGIAWDRAALRLRVSSGGVEGGDTAAPGRARVV